VGALFRVCWCSAAQHRPCCTQRLRMGLALAQPSKPRMHAGTTTTTSSSSSRQGHEHVRQPAAWELSFAAHRDSNSRRGKPTPHTTAAAAALRVLRPTTT
jgi:hypothetical protein